MKFYVCTGEGAEMLPQSGHFQVVKCLDCDEYEISDTLPETIEWDALNVPGRIVALVKARRSSEAGDRPRMTIYSV